MKTTRLKLKYSEKGETSLQRGRGSAVGWKAAAARERERRSALKRARAGGDNRCGQVDTRHERHLVVPFLKAGHD